MNAFKEIIITPEGLKKTEDELEVLKVVKRKEIAERIKEARSFGDLSENAEYDEALNAQAELELEIEKLEHVLKFAKVVDDKDIPKGVIFVGSKVTLLDLDSEEEEKFEIVGAREADPFENKISNESPIGGALMGKKKGDVVEIQAPAGLLRYKVLKIRK